MKHLSAVGSVVAAEGRLIGLVVADREEYDHTERSLQLGRNYEKAFLRAVEKSPEQKQLERDLAAAKKTIAGLNKMTRDALGKFMRDEKARVEEEARVEAKAAFDRLEREKKAEAARLEREAKKAKGQEKKDLKAQAKEVREEPVQSVESAVDEAVQKSQSSLKGASTKLWKAGVTSLTELVQWVVENPEDRIDYVQAHQVNLNKRAHTKKNVDIGVPGVIGISDDSYR